MAHTVSRWEGVIYLRGASLALCHRGFIRNDDVMMHSVDW